MAALTSETARSLIATNPSALRGADLEGCDLSNVDLRGADLSACKLKGAKFDGTLISDQTKVENSDINGASFVDARAFTGKSETPQHKRSQIVKALLGLGKAKNIGSATVCTAKELENARRIADKKKEMDAMTPEKMDAAHKKAADDRAQRSAATRSEGGDVYNNF